MSSLPPEVDTSAWYADKVRTYGHDHRGLGFRNRSSQEKRFEALLALGDFDAKCLLDVGCGFGDLLPFLHERGIRPRYTGLDICEPMIARCRERFAATEGRFIVDDVLAWEPDETYDYVVASGLFGLDARDAHARIRPTVRRMFGWARLGAAANFLSRRSPEPVPARIYVDPCEALEIGLALTPAASIDHTYLPNDFTLHLHKTPAWNDEPERTQ